MEDKEIKTTVKDQKPVDTVKTNKQHKTIKKETSKKPMLEINLIKYANNLSLAIAHAKQEAGIVLDKVDEEALAIEAETAKKANTIFMKVKKFFTKIFKHNK
jgi:hypothetical protein